MLVFVVLMIAVITAAGLIVAGRLGEMPEPEPSIPVPAPADSADLRFAMAFRGYRMDQVDDAVASLHAQLAQARGEVSDSDQRYALAENDQRTGEPTVADAASNSAPDNPKYDQ